MRCLALAIIASGVALCLTGCRNDLPFTADASGPATVTVPDAAARGPRTDAPAVFHAQSCPSAAPAPMPYPGCEACKAGEFCQELSVHGRQMGNCVTSKCARDADCPGGLCTCGPPNLCGSGNCRTADDCGGRECAADRGRYGHGSGTFCRTANDTCATHASCGAGRECAYVVDRWTCRQEVPAPPPG